MRICSAALSSTLSATLLFAGTAIAAAQTAEPAGQTLHVSSNLVVVPVTVRDSKEHFIRNLNKDDFTLQVDGKPQSIRYFDRDDDVPLTVGLLVDVSQSQRSVLDEERTASSAFLDGMLQPGRDAAFVVQFGHNADLLADVTGSVPKLQAAVQKIDSADDRPSFRDGGSGDNGDSGGGYGGRRNGRGSGGYGAGGTVLYDAVFLSADEVLKKAPAGKGAAAGQARRAVVVLTDGVDRGSKESVTAAIEAAQRNDTAIYAIYYKGEDNGGGGPFGGGGFPGGGRRGGGFPGGGGRYPGGGRGGSEPRVDGKKILERMTDETGGRVYEVSRKLPLTEIYKEIAEDLRSQYRLGFTPESADAGYHRVLVDLPKQKKLILQARDGYYTGEPAK